MARLKTFFIYALIIVLFYFYSSFLINIGIKGTYKTIPKGEILTTQPKIEVQEAKATYINGYVEGKITNNTQSKIDKKYIKIDLFSKHDTYLGTKYVTVENLEVNQTNDFRMAFKLTDVNSFKISLVDEVENATDEEFISEELTTTMILATLIVLCFI